MKRLSIALFVVVVMLGLAAPAGAQNPSTAGGTPVETHYLLARPLPRSANRRAADGFPFGWHRNNQSPLHHGVDMINGRGTPVIAAAAGTVYYAGTDLDRQFGEKTNFYGTLIIIDHGFDALEGGRVYTLYGHLSAISVEAGATVEAGQRIGAVGATGIALGSHLHFEVRLGNPDDYFAVRNPELYYPPLSGTGAIIGRMTNADGTPASGVRIAFSSASRVYYTFTYADPNLRSDPAYGENFTITDIAPGCYTGRVRGGAGYLYVETQCIKAGETLLLEVKLK